MIEMEKNIKMRRSLLCLYILLFSQAAFCEIRLPRLVSDGMCCKGRECKIRASLPQMKAHNFGKTYKRYTGKDGKWASCSE
jgi:hypothetical protein